MGRSLDSGPEDVTPSLLLLNLCSISVCKLYNSACPVLDYYRGLKFIIFPVELSAKRFPFLYIIASQTQKLDAESYWEGLLFSIFIIHMIFRKNKENIHFVGFSIFWFQYNFSTNVLTTCLTGSLDNKIGQIDSFFDVICHLRGMLRNGICFASNSSEKLMHLWPPIGYAQLQLFFWHFQQ
jgi:hypothetical protein